MGGSSSIQQINKEIDNRFNFVTNEVNKIQDEAEKMLIIILIQFKWLQDLKLQKDMTQL